MSDPRAMAARMTDKPQQYDEPTGGTPGLGLTGMDIAGALAMGGASRAETMMVMHKWVQDKTAQAPLFYAVYDEVVKLATAKKWKIPKGKELLRGLARLAISEVTDPKCCPACGGRGEVWTKGANVPVVCRTCNGMRRKEWEERDRARLVGVSESSWSKTWGGRYRMVLGIVGGFERGGLEAIRGGIKDA